MRPFQTITGVAAPLPQADVNTDAIIPSVWLRAASQDLAAGLFGGRRYDGEGRPRPDFVLNDPAYRGAAILVAGANFGCGSSREAAVWALADFGIRCVIAPSFGDIFYENCCKNGLLPVRLGEATVGGLFARLAAAAGAKLTVDLGACIVTDPDGVALPFAIAPQRRAALLSGEDEIGATLARRSEIETFQAADRQARPWIYLAGEAQ